jgi:pheromone shutdown protein TraB
MKSTSGFGFSGTFVTDTAFVLFFLALEYGRSIRLMTIDGVLMAITMMMVLVLPYFLPSRNEKPAFSNWMIGRGTITILGLVLGVAFTQSVGTVVPESMRFMPLTLLIVAAMISCYIQFYGLLKLRLAK